MRLHVHEWSDPATPALVCVHGVTGHGGRFRRLAEERLAARFHVLAPDLRGHGRSGRDGPWSLAQNAEDVLGTLPDRAVWIGHSYGGRLVLELAALAPDRVAAAILLDPAIQLDPAAGSDFARAERPDRSWASPGAAIAAGLGKSPPPPRPTLEEEARAHLVAGPDGRWRLDYEPAAVVVMYSDLCSAPPPLEALPERTLLVHGTHESLVSAAQLQAYGTRAELAEVPGDHVVYWSAYEETAGAIDRFLE